MNNKKIGQIMLNIKIIEKEKLEEIQEQFEDNNDDLQVNKVRTKTKHNY